MKNILSYIGLALFLLQVWSCEEESFSQVTTIELPAHEPRPALTLRVNAKDAILQALVSNSRGILDPDSIYKIPEDATIEIYRAGSLYQSLLFDSTAQRYRATIPPPGFSDEPGVNYELRVNIPDFEPFRVSQVMPPKPVISSVEFQPDGAVTPDGFRGDEFIIEIEDAEAGKPNFYGVEVFERFGYADPNMPGDTVYFVNRTYLDTNDPTLSYGDTYNFVFSDEAFDGGTFTVRAFNYGSNSGESNYFVRVHALSRDAFLYERSLDLYYLAVDNPFAEPVTVHSNIPDGYGVFSLGNSTDRDF